MARYQVILAYDGTGFDGFQRQASGSRGRTVQGEVESALRRIGWQGGAILAAGRTDSGVHASGQVIAFDLDWLHPLQALQSAMNANLPADIAARSLILARPDFHPRYDALARRYCYHIYCQAERDPLADRYAWRVWPAVDLQRMQQAAECLIGEHDFAAFGAPPRAGGATVRTVYQAAWSTEVERPVGALSGAMHPAMRFEISANAFLFRMVRRLVGVQVQIGQGELEVETLRQRLEDRSPVGIRKLAPPQGLTLVEVLYADAGEA